MMSNLPASTLGNIWQLADTTKSGSLVFPEFALAMYLCSSAIKGQPVPSVLPENIKKEVEKGVDWIAFHLPESGSSTSLSSGVSNAGNTSSVAPPSTLRQTGVQQTQPINLPQHATGYTPAVQAQSTGFTPTIQAQSTGYTPTVQAQATGFTPTTAVQSTGYTPTLQAQSTGYTSTLQAQSTGYTSTLQAQSTGYTPSLQTQSTGYAPTLQANTTGYPPITSQVTGYAPSLQAQPTGRPGQWGFINTPGGGLPGMDKFQSRFMPQPDQQNFTSTALEGNAKVEWAITKEEKRVYDKIFGEWDKERRGTMAGDIALKVLTQSGLSQKDLESIWTLSDPGNKGKLDRDEFAVAMHLIYRRLNNYPIPARLPPELIPPSSLNFSDSVSKVKSYLRTSSANNDTTEVSYMKNRSFKTQTNQAIKKDATVYKNNDDDMVYRSSARHRTSRNKKMDKESTDEAEKQKAVSNMSLAELRKIVHERQILLDAIDAQDEEEYDNVQDIEDKNSNAIEILKAKILDVQKEINTYPPLSANVTGDKKDLERTLYAQRSKIPKLIESVRTTESEISALKLQLFRENAERANPGSTTVGTGPGGSITDSDRRKAKNRAMLKARMASLTGKAVPETSSLEEFEASFAKEVEKINKEKETVNQTMLDIEESSAQIVRDAEGSLRGSTLSADGLSETNPEREANRWEKAIGVEDDLKDFITSLNRLPAYSGPMPTSPKASNSYSTRSSATSSPRSPESRTRSPLVAPSLTAREPPSRVSTSSPRPSTARTPAERSAYIKAEAKRRMDERMAAMGISRAGKSTASKKEESIPVARTTSVSSQISSTPPTPLSPLVSRSPVFAPHIPVAPDATITAPLSAPIAVSDIRNDESDSSSSSSDDDEDDEQFKLLLQKRAAEEARLDQLREDKAARKAQKAEETQQKANVAAAEAEASARAAASKDAKKRQKEEQMAALRAQMEAMKAEQAKFDESDSDDDSDEDRNISAAPIVQPTPQSAITPGAPEVPDFNESPPQAASSTNPFKRNTAVASEETHSPADPNAFASMLFGQMGSNTPSE